MDNPIQPIKSGAKTPIVETTTHHSTIDRGKRVNGIGLTADALSLRAAFGVTGAAQAPQARRERSWVGGGEIARYGRPGAP